MTISLTIDDLRYINGAAAPLAREVVPFINQFAPVFGVSDTVDRMACFLGQVSVESRFKFRGEIWGPTPTQTRYEGRGDLGNTQKGDGSLFRGYGGIQVTGRANATEFYIWCTKNFPSYNPPDFRKKPSEIGKGIWWVLACFWYWDTRKLNALADRKGDLNAKVKLITKKVNGGYNHLAERQQATKRAVERLNETSGAADPEIRVAQKAQDGNDPISGISGLFGAATAVAGPLSGNFAAPSLPGLGTVVELDQETIRTAQQILFRKGYKRVGKDDGRWGKNTRDAAIAFRLDTGLPAAFDVDEDGMIEAEEVMDAAFMAALVGAPAREVDPVRAFLPSNEIAQLVPEVAKARLSKIVSLGGAGLAGVPALVSGIASGFPTARSLIQPYIDAISFEMPTWGWFVVLTAVSGTTWWFSRQSEKAAVDAYRSGERVAQES